MNLFKKFMRNINNNIMIWFIIFFIVTIVNIILVKKINLEYQELWGVLGSASHKKYNPNTNIVRYFFFLGFPVLITIILSMIPNLKFLFPKIEYSHSNQLKQFSLNSFQKSIMILLLLIGIFLHLRIIIPSTPQSPHGMDTFHEAEDLGPATSFLHGDIIYKDEVAAHGAYINIYRFVLGQRIFGRSVSTLRLMKIIENSIVIIIVPIMFFILFDFNIVISTLSYTMFLFLWRFTPLVGFIFNFRDLFLPIYIICLYLLFKNIRKNNFKYSFITATIVFFMGFISMSCLAFSIDRGIYLTVPTIIILISTILIPKEKPLWLFIPSIIGFTAGFLLLGFAIQWSYAEFFDFSFLKLPKYRDHLTGEALYFGRSRRGTLQKTFPLILISGNTMWLLIQFIRTIINDKKSLWLQVQRFFTNYFMEISLLLLSGIYFRSALGNSSIGHIKYVSHLPYIFLLYIFFKKYIGNPEKNTKLHKKYYIFTTYILQIFLIVLFFSNFNIQVDKLFTFKTQITEDEIVVPDSYKKASAFLKNELSDNDTFVSLSTEAIWYYLLDKPCPTRFPTTWFAAPSFYQEEFVEDIKKASPKIILYNTETSPVNSYYKIPNQKKFSIIFNYIHEYYEPYTNIEGHEIWKKKTSD